MNKELLHQLSRLEHLTRRYYGHGMHGGGPFRGQGRVLSLLSKNPQITQKELGILLEMSKQSLAELLTKLEYKGYITRCPSEEDGRIMMISLTENGKQRAESLSENTSERKDIFSVMTAEEQAHFSDYLTRLITELEGELSNQPHPRHCKERSHWHRHHRHHKEEK